MMSILIGHACSWGASLTCRISTNEYRRRTIRKEGGRDEVLHGDVPDLEGQTATLQCDQQHAMAEVG